MTPEELERAVTHIQDRQAIVDCLMRYSRGIDRMDRELLLSAYHEDAIDDHGTFVGNREEFADYAMGLHTQIHLSHQHCLFNHTCDLDGEVAHTETYFMFVGINREGEMLMTAGGRYLDRFEKRNGRSYCASSFKIRRSYLATSGDRLSAPGSEPAGDGSSGANAVWTMCALHSLARPHLGVGHSGPYPSQCWGNNSNTRCRAMFHGV